MQPSSEVRRFPIRSSLQPKDLPDKSLSKNQYINGRLVWGLGEGALCVKCGKDHAGPNNFGPVLPAWEQSYLRSIVFPGDSPQVHFCSAGFGAYDGQTLPYGTSSSHGPTYTPSGSVNSICYGITKTVVEECADEDEPNSSDQLASNFHNSSPMTSTVNVLYGEGSGQRKRPHLDHPTLENPATMPETLPRFQAGAKIGNKGQKRVGEKTEPQPLVGMMNESTGTYGRPISVRQMLKQNKVDISWMDWIACSPDACRELKRLCKKHLNRGNR